MDLFVLMLIFFLIGGIIVTAILMAVEIKKHRPVKAATNADMYIIAGEAQMTVREDTFLRTHTVKTKVSSSDSRK